MNRKTALFWGIPFEKTMLFFCVFCQLVKYNKKFRKTSEKCRLLRNKKGYIIELTWRTRD